MDYNESWLDKLDRQFGRHAVPNLMTILTVCTVAAELSVQLVQPGFFVVHGQPSKGIWEEITLLFYHPFPIQ